LLLLIYNTIRALSYLGLDESAVSTLGADVLNVSKNLRSLYVEYKNNSF